MNKKLIGGTAPGKLGCVDCIEMWVIFMLNPDSPWMFQAWFPLWCVLIIL